MKNGRKGDEIGRVSMGLLVLKCSGKLVTYQ
jgi:hypothetical protein